MRWVIPILAGIMLALPASAQAKRWQDCGTYSYSMVNGLRERLVTTNRVQARSGASCKLARHIATHFKGGGYSYRGLTCFFAPMGSGNPYWNFSCTPGTPGYTEIPYAFVRGHSHTA